MKSVIYETKGRAREFNELACNLFTGCSHLCLYCYGHLVTHQSIDQFQHPQIRITALDILKSAKQWKDKGETRRILLCFIGDCYDPIEQETQFTRRTIQILHEHGLNVIILTKGGLRSTRDFDLLTPKDAYATTLTCFNNKDSLTWEPNAALPLERADALRLAYQVGIETWVSLEPVIYPEQTMDLVKFTYEYTGHYKIGTMNYHPHGKTINWREFGHNIKRLMDNRGIKYYFKQDLLKEMGISPDKFKQTWICH